MIPRDITWEFGRMESLLPSHQKLKLKLWTTPQLRGLGGEGNPSEGADRMAHTFPVTTRKKGMCAPKYIDY